MLDATFLHLVRRQHGAVSTHQLIDDLGWSSSAVQRAVAEGRLLTVTPGIHRLASVEDDFSFRCHAAQLFGRGDGFISARSAAHVRGLRKMQNNRVHYTVPRTFRRAAPNWIELHHSRWYDPMADREMLPTGIVMAKPLRMLFGLAADFNQYRFERAADDAWHLGLVTPLDAWRYLECNRCRGKDGVRHMERWLEKALEQRAPSQSYLERDLIAALISGGMPVPERQYPLRLTNGEIIHLDAAWPDVRLAVEPGSSWFHLMNGGHVKDHERDLACGEIGWHILRLDEKILANMVGTVRRVRTAYRFRCHDIGSLSNTSGADSTR